MNLPHGFILAVITALLALLYQSYLARLKEKIALINDYVLAVDRIEKLAIDYWLDDGKADFEREVIAAARVRGALDATASFEIGLRDICLTRYADFRALDGVLFDSTTGGDFERAARKADPARAIEIMQACHAIRAFVRAERPRLYWVR